MTVPERQGQPRHARGLIDLHLHTTASDGRCSPGELVDRALAAGLTTMAVTDHDTTAGTEEAASHARELGIELIPGIEITAIENGTEVHVLGYFIDGREMALQQFLVAQRALRVTRVRAIVERLGQLGLPVDEPTIIGGAEERGGAIGRPQVARAMMAAGYVSTVQEAFDRWLGRGCPAFLPRSGAPPESVIATIHDAGGLASLAHPGRTRIDQRIAALRDAGLDALEVFHSDHAEADVIRYETLAAKLGLLCSGGSDYHGDPSRQVAPGSASLPHVHWARLAAARERYA